MPVTITQIDARTPISGINTAVNVFHIASQDAPSVAQVNTMVGNIKTFYESFVAYRPASGTTSIGSKVLTWEPSWWTPPVTGPGGVVTVKGHFNTPPLIIGATALNASAGTGGAVIPFQLAACVSWRTATAGRSYRGRTYLGPLGTAAQSGSNLVAPMVTAVTNGATALIAGMRALTVAGSGCDLIVWSPTKGAVTPIISGGTDSVFDTMRSRVR